MPPAPDRNTAAIGHRPWRDVRHLCLDICYVIAALTVIVIIGSHVVGVL